MNSFKGNILIVDDTPENLQLLSRTLSSQGYKVRGVIKASMAIVTAKSVQPDLILLDIKMPEINGYEVCEILKADPKTCDIPIIFLSALDEVFDKVKSFQIGGVDYITKPFQVEEVLARIEHQLTIQRLQKQLKAQNDKLQKEIKERQKAEKQAKAASLAKSQFLANMSHELRTPLNSILGFTQVLRRELDITSKPQNYLNIIYRSSKHLLDLVNNILDLSKIESGKVLLNKTCFDLYRFIDQLEEMFQIKAANKKLTLLFLISANVPQYIKTDEQKLRACSINLIGNAIKFTEEGTVTFTVTREATDTEDTELKLLFSVRDTGPGIAPEEINSLFDDFVQAEKGRQSAEGTGLGLSITRRFVQLMGGEITVRSLVGQGTTFQFQIEASQAYSSEELTPPTRKAIGLEAGQATPRILVVDDTQDNRLLLVELLEAIGFEVRTADNGSEAIRLWESWHPSLIFMDTRMPVMSGLEATRRIREVEGENRKNRTAIVALTASVFEERREEILAAGSDDFVCKPFTENMIFEKIREYLGLLYIYEDLPQATKNWGSAVRQPDSVVVSELAEMPAVWLKDLYSAAHKVREDALLALLEQIPQERSALAKALKDLMNDFRLDEIVHLTQLAIERS